MSFGPLLPAQRMMDSNQVGREGPSMTDSPPLLSAIRTHYDRLAFYYRAFWGEHIHHGYWEGEESSAAAQVQLVARLAERAAIPQGARVLDVGCGFGGSALWLARHRGCDVTGITISPVQLKRASEQAQAEGLDHRVRFLVMDANHLDLPPASFDVVWIIECSEHLADKCGFMEACARVLRPGGKVALCAWLATEAPGPEQAQLISEVCRGMLCPSLASQKEYASWMRGAGFDDITAEDITRRVERTWARCAAIVERPEMRALRWLMDEQTRAFIQSFTAIRRAYADGAMAYGIFTARKI
jgi:tocopherol O-methyltransferase